MGPIPFPPASLILALVALALVGVLALAGTIVWFVLELIQHLEWVK